MSHPGRPRVYLVAAVAANRVIGAGGKLPWRLPEDLRHFKALTLGHPVIMGRKTWESIGRPLPGRRSIVISRNSAYMAPGAEVVTSLDDALGLCDGAPEAFVIGGAELYRLALARADRLLITEIDHDFDGDTRFPAPDPAQWREAARDHHARTDERPFAVDFVEYVRH